MNRERVAGMSTVERKAATIDDLYEVEGKAELVHGEIVRMSPSGFQHGWISGLIYRSLWKYSEQMKNGIALGDNVGFICQLPDRGSFSPDVSYYQAGIPLAKKRFLPEPPLFAVEIRSETDYGPKAEKALAAKRVEYFAAGTKAVWDVDPDGPVFVRLYLAHQPETAIEFHKSDDAHAEPVLPGWRLAVHDMIEEIQ